MLNLLLAAAVSASAAVTGRFAPTSGDSDGVKTAEETLHDSQDVLRVARQLDAVYADLAAFEAQAARALAESLKKGFAGVEAMDAAVSASLPGVAAHAQAKEHLQDVKDELATLLDAPSRPERLQEFADRIEGKTAGCGGAGAAAEARALHEAHARAGTALRNMARLRVELPVFLKKFQKESRGVLAGLKKADKAAAKAYAKARTAVLAKGKAVARAVPPNLYAPKKPGGKKPKAPKAGFADGERRARDAVQEIDKLTAGVKAAHDAYPAVPARGTVEGAMDAAKDQGHRLVETKVKVAVGSKKKTGPVKLVEKPLIPAGAVFFPAAVQAGEHASGSLAALCEAYDAYQAVAQAAPAGR